MDSLFPYVSSTYDVSTKFDHRNISYTQSLSSIFQASQPALAIIDPQRYYSDASYGGNGDYNTEAALENIISLKAEFNAHNLPVFVIYHDTFEQGVQNAAGGLYKISLQKNDFLIGKDSDSAFKTSRFHRDGQKLHQAVKDLKIDTLFVAGNHFNLCAGATALDSAREADLKTFVVSDCVSQGRTKHSGYVDAYGLHNAGVNFVTKAQVHSGIDLGFLK